MMCFVLVIILLVELHLSCGVHASVVSVSTTYTGNNCTAAATSNNSVTPQTVLFDGTATTCSSPSFCVVGNDNAHTTLLSCLPTTTTPIALAVTAFSGSSYLVDLVFSDAQCKQLRTGSAWIATGGCVSGLGESWVISVSGLVASRQAWSNSANCTGVADSLTPLSYTDTAQQCTPITSSLFTIIAVSNIPTPTTPASTNTPMPTSSSTTIMTPTTASAQPTSTLIPTPTHAGAATATISNNALLLVLAVLTAMTALAAASVEL